MVAVRDDRAAAKPTTPVSKHSTLLLATLALVATLAPSQGYAPGSGPPSQGVIVESLEATGAAARAGLHEGDQLLAWERTSPLPQGQRLAAGTFTSAFDVARVDAEEAPRGRLALTVRRGEMDLTVVPPPGAWRLEARPRLTGSALNAYEKACSEMAAGDVDRAAGALRRTGTAAEPGLRAWLLYRAGRAYAEAKRWEEAGRLHGEAVAAARSAALPPAILAWLLDAEGLALRRQNRPEEARQRYETALALRREAAPASLAVALSLNHLGNLAEDRGDLDASEALHTEALELRRQLAPQSLVVASSLNNLGLVASRRGDLAAAEELHRGALALKQRRDTDPLDRAASLNNLGIVAWYRGDLTAAEDLYRQAHAIYEPVDPEGADVAISLTNLGLIFLERGNLASAEHSLRRALALKERQIPGSRAVAITHNILAEVLSRQGDLEACEEQLRRALAIREKLAPGSLELAETLANLGQLALERGDVETADESYRRALEIQEEQAPGSRDEAISLHGLGLTAHAQGDLEAARQYLDQADSKLAEIAVENLDLADVRHSLGRVAVDRGELDAAERHFREAEVIGDHLAPDSQRQARVLHGLGDVHRRRGAHDQALAFLGRAVDALEAQVDRLGGGWELRADFRAQSLHLYHDLIELLLARGREAEAFHVLERSRARVLLEMLEERDLSHGRDQPPELDAERRLADVEYRRLRTALSASQDARMDELREELRKNRQRREAIRRRIRESAPRVAALRYPKPLDLAGARRALSAGTLLLEYHVGEAESHLFAVDGREGLQVFTLAIGAQELRRQVEDFRRLIRTTRLESRHDELEALARRLYGLLLEPAETKIAASRRLLISPDGPLHSLPFGALVRSSEPGSYLEAWKPVCTTLSATLHAELRGRSRRRSPPPALLAFGDPRTPGEPLPSIDDPRFLDRLHHRRSLPPLPKSREEVERIAALFPLGAAETFLGPDATEERTRQIGSDVSFVHFAGHALVDERSSLDSALVLSSPGGTGDGLLHAWEVFESVRLDADLVVLSACSSGLGKEVAGEGLIGLVRAFLFAGARSVVASQWEVTDGSTADLMIAFYEALLAGHAKDEALRHAKLRRLQDPSTAHPFHWAGFQITGDCR